MTFDQFLIIVHKQYPRNGGKFRGRLLALDPGETTGWSVWDSHDSATRYEMLACGQLPTWNKDAKKGTSDAIKTCVLNFPALIRQYSPDAAVLEAYRVYEWKTDSHAWSDVPTLRIIGAMEQVLHTNGIPYGFQTAQVAKNFVTDDRLQEWGFYARGQRHSRDSMRHGLYHLLFGLQGKQA